MSGTDPRGEISTTAWSAYGDLTADQVSARSALAAGALYQLNAAKSGRRISDYRQAERVETFALAAANDAGAHLKAAFWIAVAAQLQPESAAALIPIAQRYYQAGATLAFSASTKSKTGSVTSILSAASQQLRAYANTQQTIGIADFLADMSQSSVALQRLADVTGKTSPTNLGGDLAQYAWIGVGLFILGVVALTITRRQSEE